VLVRQAFAAVITVVFGVSLSEETVKTAIHSTFRRRIEVFVKNGFRKSTGKAKSETGRIPVGRVVGKAGNEQ
jgi:hypothetical protein